MSDWPANVQDKLVPLKHVCHMNPDVLSESTPKEIEFDYIDIGSVTFGAGVTSRERMIFADAPSRARKPVKENDIIISTVRTYLRAIARIESADAGAVVSTGFAVCRPNTEINPDYLYRAVHAHPFVDQVMRLATGISYPAITSGILGSIKVPMPKPDEQRAIAGYLDRETARIDGLIEKKDRFIALLKEKRAAVITHAVTKGVESRDRRNPCGGDGMRKWLKSLRPDLPADLEVPLVPFRYLLVANDGGAWGEDPLSDDDPIVLRSTEQAVDGTWRIEDPARRNLSKREFNKTRLRAGDILITKSSGSADHIGKASLVTEEIEELGASYSNFMQRLRVADYVHPRFIEYLLNNHFVRRQMAFLSNSTIGLANISASIIGRVQVPLPSLLEQNRILVYLDRETARLDTLITKTEQSIALLKEKRAALITAAVTGKVDVRSAA